MKEIKAHILSTSPLGEKWVQEASDQGINLDVIPFIRNQIGAAPDMEMGIRDLLSKKITAVFTSTNAVRALKEYVGQVPDWKIYCTSHSTRELASQIFGKHSIEAVADNADALAFKILEAKPKTQIHFFCGNLRRETLPEKLKLGGCTLQEWILYQTIATPEVVSRNYDAILFFSPSAVESFFSLNRITPQTRIFAIGDTTAASVKDFTENQVMVASRPNKEDLVRQAIQLITSSKIV